MRLFEFLPEKSKSEKLPEKSKSATFCEKCDFLNFCPKSRKVKNCPKRRKVKLFDFLNEFQNSPAGRLEDPGLKGLRAWDAGFWVQGLDGLALRNFVLNTVEGFLGLRLYERLRMFWV